MIWERKSFLVWIWSTCQAGFCWRFGFIRHTKNTCFWVFLFPQIDWGSNVKMSSTPFFPQKSFAKKFSKIQGQINPLSNLNLACEALFFVDFFTYSYSVFGLSSLIYSALSQNEMIHSVPKSRIQTYNHISFNDLNYTVIFNNKVF